MRRTGKNFPLLLALTLIILFCANAYSLINKGYSAESLKTFLYADVFGIDADLTAGQIWNLLMTGEIESSNDSLVETDSDSIDIDVTDNVKESETVLLNREHNTDISKKEDEIALKEDNGNILLTDTESGTNVELPESEKTDSNAETKPLENEEAVIITEMEEETSSIFDEAGDDYFDDALFIGDSRMVGVKLFGGFNNATFYCKEGMNVYYMLENAIVESPSGMLTIPQALADKNFKKIYLEIGINELGTGTLDRFADKYLENIAILESLQPNAKIFICSIMNVKKDRSESDSIVNNVNISARNERLKTLADNTNIFFVDINEFVVDEDGYLMDNYSYDSVHLLGKYYKLLGDAIRKYAVLS